MNADEQENYDLAVQGVLAGARTAGRDGQPLDVLHAIADDAGVALDDAVWPRAEAEWNAGVRDARVALDWHPVDGGWFANAVTRDNVLARVTVLPAGGVIVEEVDECRGRPVKVLGRFLSSRAAVQMLGLVAP